MNIKINSQIQKKECHLRDCPTLELLSGNKGAICIKLDREKVLFFSGGCLVLSDVEYCTELYQPFDGEVILSN